MVLKKLKTSISGKNWEFWTTHNRMYMVSSAPLGKRESAVLPIEAQDGPPESLRIRDAGDPMRCEGKNEGDGSRNTWQMNYGRLQVRNRRSKTRGQN